MAEASADPLSSGVSECCSWVEETSRRTVAISSMATFATTFSRVGGARASVSESQSLDMESTAAPAMLPVQSTQARVLPEVVRTSSLIIINQSINQSIKVICNACNVVQKLESEAWAVASGRVLMVVEKMGLEASFESI